MALKVVFSVAVLVLACQLAASAPADAGVSVSRDMSRRLEQPRQSFQPAQQQPQQQQTQQTGAPAAPLAGQANSSAQAAPAPQPQAPAGLQQPAAGAQAAVEPSQQPQGQQQITNDVPRSKRQAGIPPVCCTKDPCDPCATTPCIACPLCG